MQVITLSAAAVLVVSGSVACADVSPQSAAVWAQERAYWRATVELDNATYQSLWHHAFVGWPCDEKAPVSGLPPRIVRDHVKRSYVMDGQNVAEQPGLVSTFYHVREKDEQTNGKVELSDYDITHTWVHTRQGWKIISGMCKYPKVAH